MTAGAARASGCLFGLAYGDALGAPTEFLTVDEIALRYGPGGPRELSGDPARVTDDTQMALAVGAALLAAARASVAGAKGCGANMRVAPVGLVPGYDLDTLAGVAQLQAGLTHGHPTALAASELTGYAVRLLRDGAALADLPAALRDRCASQRTTYREDWLGTLWQRPGVEQPAEFIARGWDECLVGLDRLDAALSGPDDGGDACRVTGAGWVAEQALATGLLCALRHADDPVGALARAAATSGDSDSIACLAGAFLGAAYGRPAWPGAWADRIEYADQLAALGTAWD